MSNNDKLWGGRFDGHRNQAFDRLNASIYYDWRLGGHDVWQNRCYAIELQRIDVLSQADLDAIQKGLDQIESELQSGTFPFDPGKEDIHMNIEARLTELVGDAGKRIHTGRSRNDQVATVFRLWLRDGIDLLMARLQDLINTTLDQADKWRDMAVPGYTHLQRAQIVTFGHHLHAYGEMFIRDLERLVDLRTRLNRCPLGSGALASSPYPIDRHTLAENLGFSEPSRNSMDAVSDRDFVFEFLTTTAQIGLHLSRWAEDIILWMSSEFQWIQLPDAFCTGSSIMPQKKNPDLAELARGKSGRLLGHVTGVGLVLKGLPLTYNKDLQEDKEPVFDAWQTTFDLVDTWEQMVAAIEPNPEAMARSLNGGHLLATDLADFLVQQLGVPFREAHDIVGRAVASAEQQHIDLQDLSIESLAAIDARLDEKAKAVLTIDASLLSRARFGGPAPEQISLNLKASRQALSTIQTCDPVLTWAFALPQPSF